MKLLSDAVYWLRYRGAGFGVGNWGSVIEQGRSITAVVLLLAYDVSGFK